MRVNRLWGQLSIGDRTNRNRMHRAASRDRHRIIQRVWSIEPLEDRALLAALSGLHNIGPTGDFTSIGAAISSIQSNGLDGPLTLELQPNYVSTVEIFPLVFSNLGTTSINTITLRPELGATGLSISSDNTTVATVDLNGAQYLTIDGRAGGVGSNAGSGGGTASQLTIANTNTAGVAVRFINEASNNVLRYTILVGINTSTSQGVVVFSTTTGPNGNDNNTIDHCDIRDGASTPSIGVYALGSSDTVEQYNSGNTISNSNIFNFYGTGETAGVQIVAANSNWTIVGNSFYQTTIRSIGGSMRPIYINNSIGGTDNHFSVVGNFIGGSAPNAGGMAWTSEGNLFQGIHLIVGSTTPSSVQNNTVANIVWASSSSFSGFWTGIDVGGGAANIGNVAGNTIGSLTGTDSIRIFTSGNGGNAIGIKAFGSTPARHPVSVANNNIGSITVSGTSTTIAASFTGIEGAGIHVIRNNTIGSATTENSINATTSSTSSTAQSVMGIYCSNCPRVDVSGNLVSNLNNNYAGTSAGGKIQGIVIVNGSGNGPETITNNTVRNLSTTSQSPGAGSLASVIGIAATSLVANQTVTHNIIHSLANTSMVGDVRVTGVYLANSTASTAIIAVSNNLVHSLAISSTSLGSILTGILLGPGSVTVRNNMVRVGLDATGASSAGSSTVYGIFDASSSVSGNVNVYHNSVYVGGIQASGSNNSAAFTSGGSSSSPRAWQNNIFVNARSNSGATSKHYAVVFSSSNNTSFIAGGNIYFTSGVGGVLGNTSTMDYTTLNAWQVVTGQDGSSIVADPLFVNPTGDAASVDLHLQAINPAEQGGIPLFDAATKTIVSVVEDIDGQIRSNLSPSDIGADAEDFTSSTGDVFAPSIRYEPLTRGTTSNRVLTDWVSIDDNSGVVPSGANAPRLYFRKSTDSDVFNVPNDSTGNGWKYVTATGNGPYSFTMDYSIIRGGSVSVGDTIRYFVAAQDSANNLASSPAGATSATNPPVQSVNSSGLVNSFNIVNTLSGMVTVGIGGTYPTLNGLFSAINISVLTGNVVAKVIGDLSEPSFGNRLLEFNANERPSSNAYTLTIQPDGPTMRTVSGASTTDLIGLSGVNGVIIDGRFAGAGRFLTFRNTSTGSGASSISTIRFSNDASNNILRNIIVEGAGASLNGVIAFGTGTARGNDNNLITESIVRDISTASTDPRVLIGSSGRNIAANSGNVISNNELFNFSFYGINISNVGNETWTIADNKIAVGSRTSAAISSTPISGILLRSAGNNAVTDNSIELFATSQIVGINYQLSTGSTTVSRNRIDIQGFGAFGTSTGSGYGVYANGDVGSTLNLINNQISVNAVNAGSTYGIRDSGPSGSVVNAFYNTVLLSGTGNGTGGASISAVSFRNNGSTHTARNNLFLNLRAPGDIDHSAVYNSGVEEHYFVSNNVYAGTGLTTPENFMRFRSSGSFIRGDFASWQAAVGDLNSQAGVAGTGDFTSAMFVDAANGDLRLVTGGNSLVNGRGMPIPGITTDFEGDLRNSTAPDIGADERDLTPPRIVGAYAVGSTWSAGMVDGGGMGAGNGLGYELTAGLTLPNAGIDRIYVQFNEPVVGFDASNVALLGVDVADYASLPGMMTVSYDAANRRGVIQLTSALSRDKLRLGVSDAIKDRSLNALDGDSNASAGGVMDLRFNVLVGDANNDGSVNGGDLPFFANAFNTSVGSLQYNPRADWNASGSVNGGDLPLFASRFNQSLPNAEPGALGFPPASPSSDDSDSMLATPIEDVEEFFGQLEEDDEMLVFESSVEAS